MTVSKFSTQSFPVHTFYFAARADQMIPLPTCAVFQGCWVEKYKFHGFRGSSNFPGFLRRLNGLGHVTAGTLFPSREFDDQAQRQFEQIVSAIAEIEPYVALVNDLLSYFKEFGDSREQVNLVRNWAYVDDMPVEDAFQRLADETIRTGERLVTMVKDFDPGFRETVLGFVHGYVSWHFCDQRYRMADISQLASHLDSAEAARFCEYYETTMRAWGFGIDEWAKAGCSQDGT